MSEKKHDYDTDRIIRSLEDGFLRADNDGYIVMANEAIAAMCGYSSPEEMIGMHMKELYANPGERDHLINEIKEKGKLLNYQMELLRQDGSRFWSLNNIKTFSDEKGNLLGTEGVIRDITKLRHTEEKLEHANKVLAAIRNMNQLITVEKNTAKLLQGICNNLTENRGYHNVWIMLLNEKAKFESLYQAGLRNEFKHVEKKLKKGDFTKCAIETLKQKDVVIITDPKEECSDCSLAELYEDRGAMTAPIIHNDKLFGLITASIPKKYLTKYDFDLFKEVANDIGLALHSIMIDQARVTAEKNLEASNQQLQAANQQLIASEEELRASNQQLAANEEELQAANQQLKAANQQLAASEQQLKANEAELNRNLESLQLGEQIAGLGYFERNWQTGSGFWSKGFYSLLGVNQDEVDCNHEDFMKFIHPDDVQRTAKHIKSTLQDQTDMNIEFRLIQSDGNVLQIHGIGKNFFDKDGKPLNTIGTFQDITERKNTEIELKKSEAKFRSYVDNAPDGIFICDEKGKYLEVNQAACDITGYSQKELLQKHIPDILQKTEIEKGIQHFKEVQEKGSARGEIGFVNKKGEDRVWHVAAVKLSNTHFLGFVKDITDSKIAEKELENTLEATTDGIWTWNFKTNVLYFSPKYYTMLEYKPNEFEANFNNWADMIHPDDRAYALNVAEKYLEKKPDNYENEFRTRTKDGDYRWIRAKAKVVERDKDGKAVYMIGNHEDITEKKKAEESLKESEERFKQLSNLTFEGILIHDNGVIVDVNQSLLDLFGYSLDEVIGKSLFELALPKEFHKEIYGYFQSKKVEPYQVEAIKKDGMRLPIEIIAKEVFLEGKSLRVAAIRDITKRKQAEEALKESELKYKTIVEGSIQGLVIAQSDPVRLSFASSPMEKITGYTPNELMNFGPEHLNELIYPDDRQRFFSNFLKRLQGEEIKSRDEYRIVQKNGSINWVELFSSVINYDGYPATQTVFIDITDKKKAEDDLKESHNRFRLAGNVSYDLIYEWDVKTDSLKWFGDIDSMLGFKQGEISQNIKHWLSLIHPDDQDKMKDAVELHRTSKEKIQYEYKIKTKNATWRYWQDNALPLFDEKGKPYRWIGVCTDITERKKAEKALKESEASLQDAQRIANIGSWLLDLTTGQVYMSDEMLNIIGINKNEAADVTMHEKYYTPESWKRFQEAIKETQETGKSYEIEMEFADKNAEFRYAIARGEPVYDENNKLIALKGTLQDITKQNQYEAKLIEAKEKAEESDRLKSAFLSNMSHEIRTPMNGILGFSDLLKTPDLKGSEKQKYIEIIEKSGKRMLNIINDIIDISKIESGAVEVNMKKVNINKNLNYVLSFFKPEAENKGLNLILNNTLPEKDAIIVADSEKVSAVLINLIKNAIKYTDKGFIEFGCEYFEIHNSKFLRFSVQDTGIGIAKDRQEAIFERFIQADIEDVQAREGAGLGLSISKSYIEMLGGKLWLESKEGKGSTFYFTIPFNQVKKKEIDVENKSEINNNFLNLNLKVLVAEDDEASSDYISIVLKDCAKEIINVETGAETIEVFRNNPDIDLILMDIRMPDINGYEATQQIRKINKDVIIIAQTAYGLSGDREKALKAGCNDYIAKPIKKAKLLELIQKYFTK
ncbi:MAG: PAS domain S-box protein [Bacteroidales bacterium]|nr:PAS domain S-box protein [Bacteroidales bacterium]